MSKVQYGNNFRGFPSLTLSVSTNNSKYLDFFRTGPSQIAMIRSTLLGILGPYMPFYALLLILTSLNAKKEAKNALIICGR